MVERKEEITLKDVFQKVGEYFFVLMNNALLILLFGIICGVLFFIRNNLTPVEYKAECTFMLNDQEGGGSIGISNILGQFGLGGGGEFKLEKIAELSKTRAMTIAVMMDTVTLASSDLLANHYIQEKAEHKDWVRNAFWQDPGPLKEYRFTSSNVDGFERMDNSALILLNRRFKEDVVTDIDEATGILTFSLKSTDEELGYELLNRLFDKVSAYYTGKSIEKQQATYDALASKCDSLEGALNEKEYALAQIKDSYRGRWLNTEKVEEDMLFRDIRMLTVMYGEALKNKELAAFSLENMTPFIQAIDRPIIPLQRLKEPIWMAVIKGLILGLIIGGGLVMARKLYRDIMADS